MAIALETPPAGGHIWNWRDQSIYYVHEGNVESSHPSVLLIHGFGASTDHWRKNIAHLKNHFDVWAIDLLGFGRSSKPDWQYSSSLWREQIQDFIQDHIQKPTVIAGNSLGGYVALSIAASASNQVAGVVLLNSAGPFSDAIAQPSAPSWRQALGKAVRMVLLQPLPSYLLFQYSRRRSTIRKTLKKVYLDQSAITDQLVEDIYRPSCDRGAAKVFASVFKSPRGETVDTLLKKMNCPLLLLWGEADPWINTRDRGAKFREYYSNLSEHYLRAGHCPHDEVPGQVNSLMKDWILQQA